MIIEVKIQNNLPFLFLRRDITPQDFGPVKEVANSILYILGEDEEIWEGNTLKIRLKQAFELDRQLRELSSSNKANLSKLHWVALANICKVHTIQTNSTERTKVEDSLRSVALEETSHHIKNFNAVTLFKGLCGEFESTPI